MPLRLMRSLRAQIVAWSFVPTAIILLAVALVAFYAYQRSTADLVLQQSEELTRLSANQFATHLRDYTDVLEDVSRSLSATYRNRTVLQETLRGAANRLVTFDAGVVALDNYGRVIATQPPRDDILGQDWSDRSYFRDVVRAGQPAFSDVAQDGAGGQDVVVMAAPVTNDSGELLGALAGMFRVGATTTSALYGSVIRLRAGPGVETVLVDSNGRAIYHSDVDEIGASFEETPAVAAVNAGRSGAQRAEAAGEAVVSSHSPVPGTPWGLVRETSWNALMEPTAPYRRFLVALLALGVLVPAVVVAWGVRRIIEPINRLTSAAQDVAGGKFGETIPSGSFVEVERLVDQFNSMSRQLSATYDDLRRKNEQLELVMAGANDGIWDWDLRANKVYLSPRWKSMLGYADDELPNHEDTWPALAHPDDKPRVQEVFRAYMAGESPTLQVEHRLRCKDGAYRWLLMRGMALRDASGKPYRVAGSNTDISELKRSQGILHAQSRFLEGIASGEGLDERLRELILSIEEHWPGSRCVVWLVDDNTRQLEPAAVGALGMELVQLLQTLMGRSQDETPSATAVRRRQRVVIEDVATDPRWDAYPETRAYALQNSLRAAWAEPIVNSEGVGLGAFSVYHLAPHKATEDETEMIRSIAHLVGVAVEARHAEQALRASEARFRTLFESADVGIVVSDLNGELVEVNPAVTRILGLAPDEVRTLPATAYIHPEDTAIREDLIQELHAGKRERYQIERRYIRKDGEVIWGRLTVTLARQADGKALYRIAMLDDITEERRAQEDLQAAYRDLERRVQERTRALIALNTVAGVVSRSLELREIARDALAVSAEMVGCDHGAVYVTDESGKFLELVAERNHSPQFIEAVQKLPIDQILPDVKGEMQQPEVWGPDDLDEGPLKAILLAEGLSTVVTIPLISKDQLVGSMSLSCSRPRALTPEESGLLMAIGRQIGVGIDNARLYEQEQERRDEAERRRRVAEGLREVLSVLNSGQSLYETLDLIARQACQMLGADGSAVMRLDTVSNILAPQSHHGLTADFVQHLRIEPGTVASGRALAERRAILIPDTVAFLEVLRERKELPKTMPAALVEEVVRRFRALLTVPIMIGDNAYGTLSLYYHDPRPVSQEDIGLAQTMADQAALAIDAARLREQAKTSAAAEERNRLARELHDSVTQNLYSVTLYAEAAARLLSSGATEMAAEHLRDLRDTSQEALREMRLLIFELRPMDLQKMGLAGAINARLQAVETRGGIRASLVQEGVEYAPLMSPALQEEIYHIAQETLNNTLKHARAKNVTVSLNYGPQMMRLQVRDDGQGFAPELAVEGGGLGLRGMRERAARVRGCLTIDSAPGKGATVTVEAPVDIVAQVA